MLLQSRGMTVVPFQILIRHFSKGSIALGERFDALVDFAFSLYDTVLRE
jgi:hypothetical protein